MTHSAYRLIGERGVQLGAVIYQYGFGEDDAPTVDPDSDGLVAVSEYGPQAHFLAKIQLGVVEFTAEHLGYPVHDGLGVVQFHMVTARRVEVAVVVDSLVAGNGGISCRTTERGPALSGKGGG